MFRVYNRQELQRLTRLLQEFDNDSVSFPLDIFRTENAITAFPYGENDKKTWVTSRPYSDLVELEELKGANLREIVSEAEGEYACLYGVTLLRFPIEKTEILA